MIEIKVAVKGGQNAVEVAVVTPAGEGHPDTDVVLLAPGARRTVELRGQSQCLVKEVCRLVQPPFGVVEAGDGGES